MILGGQPKRRHHHVWQYYLRAWESNGVVACRRDGRVFSTGTEVLGVKKDLYRIKHPTEAEIDLLAKLCFPENMNPLLRKLNGGWLPVFLGPMTLERLAVRLGSEHDTEISRILELARSNTEEDLHMVIESDSIANLNALRTENLSFLADEDERGQFLHFLATQDFRTQGKHQKMVRSVDGLIADISFDNIIAPMTHIFATNVAFGLMRRWETTRVTLLKTEGDANFITGGQPVFNSHAVGLALGELVDEIQYYFPVSPSLALLWDAHAPEASVAVEIVGRDRVEECNAWVESSSWEQVYAKHEATLRE